MKPKKNYIIITIIFILTISLCLYLRELYLTRTTSSPSIIENYSSKINEDEINNHVIENPTVVLYLSPNNLKYKEIDKKINKALKNTNTNVLYINTSEANKEKLINTLNSMSDEKLTYQDNAIYIFQNSKLIKHYDNLNELKEEEIERILKVMQ